MSRTRRPPTAWQQRRPHASRRSRGSELPRLSPVAFRFRPGVVRRVSPWQFPLRHRRSKDGHDLPLIREQAQYPHRRLRRLPQWATAATKTDGPELIRARESFSALEKDSRSLSPRLRTYSCPAIGRRSQRGSEGRFQKRDDEIRHGSCRRPAVHRKNNWCQICPSEPSLRKGAAVHRPRLIPTILARSYQAGVRVAEESDQAS